MPLILGTNSIKDTGYNVDNSLRFNSAGPDDLSKTFGTATDTKKWTCSFWWKPAIAAAQQQIFSVTNGTADDTFFHIQYRDNVEIRLNGYNTNWLTTNRKFRDYSAWYHVVVSADSTQGTAANRLKLYINGTEETSFATDNRGSISEDQTWGINLAQPHFIGSEAGGGSGVSGYLSEFVMIDGLRLDPTSFGEFDSDSGIWKPINVSSLTFGNNGFYQEYKQAGTGTNSSGMGADTSGNGNHFAVSNLAAVDQSTDTCTNNHMTWNPLYASAGGTYTGTEGNLHVRGSDSHNTRVGATFAAQKGKWYWEVKQLGSVTNGGSWAGAFEVDEVDINGSTTFFGNQTKAMGVIATSSTVLPRGNGQGSGTTLGDIAVNGILMFAMDIDNGFLYVGLNGTFLNSGDPSTGASGTGNINNGAAGGVTYNWDFEGKLVMPGINIQNADFFETNFGSPSFAISSGNTDANGHGNFEYAVPSGYFTWNTKNLAEFG